MLPKKYFDIKDLHKQFPDSRYFFIIGGRSIGKTYSVMQDSIDDAIDGKGIFAYVRRYKDSITQTQLQDLLSVHNQHVFEKTDGLYNKITFYRGRWYLENWDYEKDKRISRCKEPIGAALAINTWETSKGADIGAAYGGVKNIILDEALSKGGNYLRDEWSMFQNVVSSLVRDRTDLKTRIYLLANPVSKWSSEYFDNLGITHKMLEKEGTTLIKYPDTDMTTVFCYMTSQVLQTDDAVYNTYFAFPNSRLKNRSITDGIWELEDSDRLPHGVYKESTNIKTVYIYFAELCFKCEIMRHDCDGIYYIVYSPSDKIKEGDWFFINKPYFNKRAIVLKRRGNDHPLYQLVRRITMSGQVYYSDNVTADAIHGFYNSLDC